MIDVLAPPPFYDGAPSMPVPELRLPFSQIDELCRLLGADSDYVLRACAKFVIGGCLIILPRVDQLISERDQAALRRHEIAHCNGWPRDHSR